MPAQPIPDGCHALTPYFAVKQAADTIEDDRRAFGAKERLRLSAPGGRIGRGELEIGDSVVMIDDEFPAKRAATHSSGSSRRALSFGHVRSEKNSRRWSTGRPAWVDCSRSDLSIQFRVGDARLGLRPLSGAA